jgi:pimeloyl-ACP methyl ester carboxylesterase
MKPFFFGAAAKPLFGVYHSPADDVPPRGGVMVCYPFGPEYLRSHRALRELATQLAATGHHVLRFDYFGCGDSSGETEEGTVEQWLDDITRGVEELRESSGRPQVCVLGLRFGATLAALGASRDPGIDRLILWDPVVNGRDYLEELDRRNHAFMEGRPRPPSWVEGRPPVEVLGTLLPRALRESIEGIDLLSLASLHAKSLLVLTTDSNPGLAPLMKHLESLGLPAQHQHIPFPPLWLKQDHVDRTLVPHQVIQGIASWLSRGGA